MSLRSKVTNTLGPSSLRPVLTKSWVTNMGQSSTSDWIAPPLPGTWLMEDSLATTANLSFSGGTWDTSGGVLAMASPNDNTEFNVRHSYPINTAFERHIVQVELRIPTGYTSGVEVHMDVGFNTTSWSSGGVYFSARSRGTTKRASWLRSAVAWTDGPIYNHLDATWYTHRMVWDVPTNTFTGYIDGTQITTFSQSQSETGMYPILSIYRASGTPTNFQFRNLKYWGGSASEPMP